MELGIHYHTKRRTVHPGMYMVAGRSQLSPSLLLPHQMKLLHFQKFQLHLRMLKQLHSILNYCYNNFQP